MFCFQCEQTFRGTGCVDRGVCGKDHPTATLQDLLIHLTKGVSMYAHRARQLGVRDAEVDRFVLEALFTTVTNVNFDYADLSEWVQKAQKTRDQARRLYTEAAGNDAETLLGAAVFEPSSDLAGQVKHGAEVSITVSELQRGSDVAGLIELYMYGLKGAAAYAEHARRLGQEDVDLYGRFHEALAFLGDEEDLTSENLLNRCLDAGMINHRAMELLDEGNTGAYGHPQPTRVRTEAVAGKAILVSGHDLRDLAELLEQTEGQGINVYTHGEMLPAHGYPELSKHPHLVGNWGGAWQDQQEEFPDFPGPILLTTNCIQRPMGSYFDRIFTSGMTRWPGVTHIADGDFTPVIEAARAAKGFGVDAQPHEITVGFGHAAVLGVAETVVEAVKSGALRHFFLVGGCDGAKPGRNYFRQFAELVPPDCAILTLACGKYRFNKLEFGQIGALPRLLDIGQCNDAFAALQIAQALASALECEVNELPLSFILSWYEQKAVAILLTLLALGIRNIRLGPSLPAFITPAVLALLKDEYNLTPVGKVDEDLRACLSVH